MISPEIDLIEQELALTKHQLQLARYALFDELIDFALDGQCTLDEAVDQYLQEAFEIDPELGA